jgi:hypothetical protein
VLVVGRQVDAALGERRGRQPVVPFSVMKSGFWTVMVSRSFLKNEADARRLKLCRVAVRRPATTSWVV